MTQGLLPLARQLIFQTITDPRAAARRVMSFGLSYPAALMATGVVAALALILGGLAYLARGPGRNQAANALMSQPAQAALFYFAMTVGLAGAAVAIGRAFGGRGRHAEGLALFAWFQAMTVLIQGVQLILLPVLPALALFLGLLALGWMPWALSHFIATLHGFRSVLKVMAAAAISLTGLIILLAILLTAAGVRLPGAS